MMASRLEFVVHARPGTGPDVMAQAIVQSGIELGLLPPDTIVSHRPGHDGAEAMQYLMERSGSPNIVSTCTPTFLTTPLKAHLGFTYADLTPICRLVADSYLLVTPSTHPWATMQDLIAAAREKPAAVTVGAAPKGGNNHIHAHLIANATGTKFSLRFFSSSQELLEALASHRIDWTTAVAAEVRDNVQDGKLRILGALSKQRSPLYPDVPTLKEEGVPVTFSLWRGIIGPPSVPDDARSRIESSLRRVTKTESWKSYLKRNGQQAAFLDSASFGSLLSQESTEYRLWLTDIGVIC